IHLPVICARKAKKGSGSLDKHLIPWWHSVCLRLRRVLLSLNHQTGINKGRNNTRGIQNPRSRSPPRKLQPKASTMDLTAHIL
ncbi:unnamed protein product, partial [Linum tenue]